MIHQYGKHFRHGLVVAALTLLAVGASAQTEIYIYTAEELHNIRNNPGGDYILMNDIDLDHATLSALYGNVDGTQGSWYDEQKGWLPIGVPNEYNIYQIFFGTFDGGGHVIRNLYINRPGEYENNPPGQGGKIGLFGWTAGDPNIDFNAPPFGEIRNLGVEDADVTGAESVGILLGQNYGTIENCWSTGTVTAIGANPWGQPFGSNNVGGLIGVITKGAVADCYSTATVVAEGYAAGGFAGGIAGSNPGPTVDRCFATGDVTAFISAGGFASGIQSATVRDCYSMGSVTATGERFGLSSVGGFAGYLSNGWLGGDAPLRCYTISAVQGPGAEVEPFIGNIDEAFENPVDCFYNSDINGLPGNGMGTPLTTAQMTYPYDAAAYTNYDFTTVWVADASGDNGGYPYHAWYTPTPPQPTATIVCDPQTLTLIDGVTPGEMTVEYLGGNGPIWGFEILVSWDDALADAEVALSANFAGVSNIDDDTPGELLISGTRLASIHEGIDLGDLFTLTFTGLDGGSSVVDLTVNAVADYASPPTDPLPVAEDGQLDVDLTPPTIAGVEITNTTLNSTDWVKNTDTIEVTATVTDNGTLETVTCDLTGFGGGAAVAPDGAPVGDVYTWTLVVVTTTPADGPVSATVTATDDLGNSASAADDITADNTAPQALTGLVAMPSHKAEDNGSGGTNHFNQIVLSWDDPSGLDDNLDRVEFRYVTEGGYPVYTTGAPGSPDLPAAPLATDALAFTETSSPFEWYLLPDGTTPLPRDVYAVAAYVYDAAGNVSSISDVAYATSYYLGDVGPDEAVGDGLVDPSTDIYLLAEAYGTATDDPLFNQYVDVGPTLDYTRFGIPAPDGVVGFQDLMIFAMNFDEGVPTAKSQGAMGTPVFAWNQVDERTWALELVYECAGLKGINVTSDLPDGVTVTVGGGQMMSDQEAQVFLRNIDRNGLDAGMAVMGNGEGFRGAGTLLLVTTSQPVADLQITVDARGLNNEDLLADLQQPTGVELPAQFELGQNYPNPFNPQTTIKFALPEAANVKLKIYGVDGRLVRTLVNESRSAGHHEVIWRGVDDASRPVATGTYFYVIDAGDHHEVRKMTLVK